MHMVNSELADSMADCGKTRNDETTVTSIITIHDDFCKHVCPQDVQSILDAIAELITEAVVRSAAEQSLLIWKGDE